MSLRSRLSVQYRRILRTWDFYSKEAALTNYFQRGHFYSPLPDCSDGMQFAAEAYERQVVNGLPSIDLRADAQKELLLKIVDLYPDFDWSEQPLPGRQFHFNQGWYKQADSICLYAMLRLFRPRCVVEVGSGFSSALMLDVDELYLGQQTTLTFIEPHPERLESLLTSNDKFRVRVICQPVQNISMDAFSDLKSGDFLFIDLATFRR